MNKAIALSVKKIPGNLLAPWRRREGYCLSPVLDFLLAGGGGGLFLALLWWWIPNPSEADYDVHVPLTMGLAYLVNYPHFAHSYQLLYKNFHANLRDPELALSYRLRLGWCGIAVPLLLAVPFLWIALAGDAATLGQMVNVMLLTVGWHYVKQGCGVLMVLSAKRGIYFGLWEKRILLANAYLVWLTAWLWINDNSSGVPLDYMGVPYYAFAIPFPLMVAAAIGSAFSGAAAAFVFFRRLERGLPISLNGFIGYCVTLYLWMFIFQASMHLIYVEYVPMFHSLQYLLFVWCYKLNETAVPESHATLEGSQPLNRPFWLFISVGIILGWFFFYNFPGLLDYIVPYDQSVVGVSAITVAFILFINIHHYFIDNVIWRKENPAARRYLMGR